MTKLIVLLSVLTILAVNPLAMATLYLDDGDSHDIYEYDTASNERVYLDLGVSHTPGTHLNLEFFAEVDLIYMFNNSTLAIDVSTIHRQLFTYDNSSVEFFAGLVGKLTTDDNSIVIMKGGFIEGNIEAYGNSEIFLTGGLIGDLILAKDASVITLSGGSITGNLLAYDDALLYIDGNDLAVNGIPLEIGDKLTDFAIFKDGYYSGTITGTLNDGTAINNEFKIYNTGYYEGTADIIIGTSDCLYLLAGDFDENCRVNIEDAAFLAENWLTYHEEPYETVWTRQLGTNSSDMSHSIAIDSSGNSFITGSTRGDLAEANAGYEDIFLAKYDSSGNHIWSRQLGSSNRDYSYSVATDSSGNAFITGATLGDLSGPNAGGFDAFLAKYDADGNLLWIKMLGSTSDDWSYSVAVDASDNAFITGATEGDLGGPTEGDKDMFLAKYNSEGDFLWSRQFGIHAYNEVSRSVAIDPMGNVFICGENEDGEHYLLLKYDNDGNSLWIGALALSAWDSPRSVAVDSKGNAYISGTAQNNDSDGVQAGLAKYSPDGEYLWGIKFGGLGTESSNSVTVDSSDNIFISGRHFSRTNNILLAKYDTQGNLIWSNEVESAGRGVSLSVKADSSGDIYISGWTRSNLDGNNFGSYHAFLIKYTPSDSCNTVLPGDLDGNCKVDLADFAILASNWMIDCDGDPADSACLPLAF